MLAASLLLFTQAAAAQSAGRVAPSALAPSEIVAAAPAADWVDVKPDDLLVMTLAPDAKGRERKVVIQLMPPPFSQGWVANIRKLAAAHFWDGTSVNRVQDNYVAQWGDANAEDKAKAKPLPAGLSKVPESEYLTSKQVIEESPFLEGNAGTEVFFEDLDRKRAANEIRTATIAATHANRSKQGWHERDAYARWVQHGGGWLLASDRKNFWPVHCYGMVGVGRNLSPDTGSGAELYTVIGHAPRHLDRNIALVGRVIAGIEHLSSLPRGTEALGFYKTAEERTPIVSIRLASELPTAEQPHFQYLSTESASFARYADARANRRDPFFNVPAGGADICNIPVPVRKRP